MNERKVRVDGAPYEEGWLVQFITVEQEILGVILLKTGRFVHASIGRIIYVGGYPS